MYWDHCKQCSNNILSYSGHSDLNRFQATSDSGELDELEQLCAEKEPFTKHVADQEKSLARDFTEEDFEQQLEQLVLEKDQPDSVRDKENQPQSSVASLSYVRDKENVDQIDVVSRFDFTPNTVDGGVHWPGRVNR